MTIGDVLNFKHNELARQVDKPVTRLLSDIAYEISRNWGGQGRGVNYAAVPYLQAMRTLDTIDGDYGQDSAREIVARFLGNAGSWRGETAKRVKAELKGMLAGKGRGR